MDVRLELTFSALALRWEAGRSLCSLVTLASRLLGYFVPTHLQFRHFPTSLPFSLVDVFKVTKLRSEDTLQDPELAHLEMPILVSLQQQPCELLRFSSVTLSAPLLVKQAA